MWSLINFLKDGMADKLGFSSYLTLVIFNIIYFSTLFGILIINTTYIDAFNIAVHIILCLFLMYRFNPFRTAREINKYDQIIIFSSASFLLLNLGIVEYVKKIFDGENNILRMNTKLSL
jgi:hypothetical protein